MEEKSIRRKAFLVSDALASADYATLRQSLAFYPGEIPQILNWAGEKNFIAISAQVEELKKDPTKLGYCTS